MGDKIHYVKNYDNYRGDIKLILRYGTFDKAANEQSKRLYYIKKERYAKNFSDNIIKDKKSKNISFDINYYKKTGDFIAKSYRDCSFNFGDTIFYLNFLQMFNIHENYNSYKDLSEEISLFNVNSEFTFEDCNVNFYDVIKKNCEIIEKFSDDKNNDKNLKRSKMITDSQFEKRFSDMIELGIIKQISDCEPIKYILSEDIFSDFLVEDLIKIQKMVDFFYNFMVVSVPGFFLYQSISSYITANLYNDDMPYVDKQLFIYKNNNISNTLVCNIIWSIINAMNQFNIIEFIYFDEKIILYPIKIIVDPENFTSYCYGYNYIENKFVKYALQNFRENIIVNKNKKYADEKFSFINERYKKYEDVDVKISKMYEHHKENSWIYPYDTDKKPTEVVLHFKCEDDITYKKTLFNAREYEKNAVIKELSDFQFEYTIYLKDETHIATWVKSFGYKCFVDKEKNPELYNILKNEFKECFINYGIV